MSARLPAHHVIHCTPGRALLTALEEVAERDRDRARTDRLTIAYARHVDACDVCRAAWTCHGMLGDLRELRHHIEETAEGG